MGISSTETQRWLWGCSITICNMSIVLLDKYGIYSNDGRNWYITRGFIFCPITPLSTVEFFLRINWRHRYFNFITTRQISAFSIIIENLFIDFSDYFDLQSLQQVDHFQGNFNFVSPPSPTNHLFIGVVYLRYLFHLS